MLPDREAAVGASIATIRATARTLAVSCLTGMIIAFLADGLDAQCFVRAEANCDGQVDISDPVYTLNWLFSGGPDPCCIDAADSDDDGAVNITDPIVTLSWLFQGGPAPQPPAPPACGPDPTDDALGCLAYPHCVDALGCGATGDEITLVEIPDQTITLGSALDLEAPVVGDGGADLEYSLLTSPPGMTVSSPDGRIRWQPIDEALLGVHDVTVAVEDESGSADLASLVVTVTRSNQAPVAGDDVFTASHGVALRVDAPGVLANDSDENGDALQARLVTEPTNGVVELLQDGSFEYTPLSAIPTVRENLNLSLVLFSEARPGGTWNASYRPEQAVDNNPETAWSSRSVGDQSFELEFAQDVTVRRLEVVGPRNSSAPFGAHLLEARFLIFDRSSSLLWESGPVQFEEPGDVSVEVGEVPNAARVRIEPIETFNGIAALGEFHVFGDAVPERFAVAVEWTWEGSDVLPESVQAMATPLVADLNVDGMPEVIFATSASLDPASDSAVGQIRVVRGDGGAEVFTTSDPEAAVLSTAQLAVGNIDESPELEIIAVSSDKNFLRAFSHAGELLWTSERLPGSDGPRFGGPSLADLDGDGQPEILVAVLNPPFVVALDAAGSILWSTQSSGGGLIAGFATAADVDLDGEVEIVAGNSILTHEGELVFRSTEVPDGAHALGNFDDDPFPEVAVSSGPTLYLMDDDGRTIWSVFRAASSNSGAPPTVADFDGDGGAEIGLAAAGTYTVFDADGSILWSHPITDSSSGATGSTVFDFDNDGSAEVVYSDELWLWVFRGSDGAVLLKTPLRSGTVVEYPVIADVDADGHAEIVAVANQVFTGGEQHGLWVFGGLFDDWVRARPIWNQHAYHVTNVEIDGTIPAAPRPFWLLPGLNSFRQNSFQADELGAADRFTYRAADNELESNLATVYIETLPENTAPEIQSAPDSTGTVGFRYVYAALAVDVDLDPLVFSLVDAPPEMTIDRETGLLRWTPPAAGEFGVSIRVEDDDGFAAFQRYTIQVVEPSRVPDVRGQTEAVARSTLEAESWDPGPTGLAFHPTVAAGLVVSQSPPGGAAAEPGSRVDLVLSRGRHPRDVDDDGDGFTENHGDCDDDDRAIFPGADEIVDDGVDQDCDGAEETIGFFEIVVTPVAIRTLLGREHELTALALQNDGTSRFVDGLVSWQSADESIVTVDASGLVRTVGGGITEVTATLDGLTGTMAIWVVEPAQAIDVTPPEADIAAPLPGETLTSPVDIVGTASDENMVGYVLEIAPAGSEVFTLVAEGTTSITTGVLGSIDPTTLLGDNYDLRLTVDDAAGNRSSSAVPITIEGGLAVGQFSLVFRDLTVPAAGLPIDVLRVYDTRDKARGDFGIGWRLGFQTVRVRSNRTLGEGWIARKFGLSFALVPAGEHKVSVHLPAGRVEVFDFQPTPNVSVLAAPSFTRPAFIARPGTRGTLRALDLTGMRSTGGEGEVVLVDATSGATADPELFLYTYPNGTEIEIVKGAGVRRIRDPNDNEITISRAGIEHSSGASVVFERDQEDRIARIVDPLGAALTYTYSALGDLVAHTDRAGEITRYKYDQRHALIEIVAANGVSATRYEYDDGGRLVAIIDAEGNRTEIDHDIEGQVETTRNPDGTERLYEYDERGNVLTIVDELGNVSRNTFDEHDRLLTETNASGETTSRQYDAEGEVVAITLPSGATIRYERDESGRMTRRVGPNGGVTRYEWDSRGNLVSTTDALGHTSESAYDARGQLIRQRDARGNIQSFEYDDLGRLVRVLDATGSVRSLEYDASGNLLSTSMLVTTPEGPRIETFEFSYDAANRPNSIVAPDDNELRLEYDALGLRSAIVAGNGQRTEMSYGLAGGLERVRYADGEELALLHNPRDQVSTFVLPSGRTSDMSYDAAGRPIGLIFQDDSDDPGDNPRIEVELDASGRASSVASPAQGDIAFERDEAGLLSAIETSQEGRLDLTTDALGRLTSSVDELGRTIRYEYDLLDRTTRIDAPDGVRSFEYDSVGNLVRLIDRGQATDFDYDEIGRLLAVTDATGRRTEYRYDEIGRLVAQLDALGRETRQEYDSVGQRTALVWPSGRRKEYQYNELGQVSEQRKFDGETLQFEYDLRGRLVERRVPDGESRRFEHDADGRRTSETDVRGTTRYAYDPAGRLVSRTEPDGRQISYTWNPDGYLAAMTVPSGTIRYGYSEPGVLSSVTSANGDVVRYTRNATRQLTRIEHPNGLVETRAYDELGHIARADILRGDDSVVAAWQYEYDARSRKSSVLDADGRRVDWEYDELDQLLVESIADPERGDRTTRYVYDEVGNRIRNEDSELGVTTYSYDEDDRLLETSRDDGATTTYTYDTNGSLTSVESAARAEFYDWSPEGRLVRARIVEVTEVVIEYRYDADGNLVSRSVDGVETRYLVDTQRPFAQVVEESAVGGQVVRTNVWGDGLVSVQGEGGARYPLVDAHSGVRLLTDAGGIVTSALDWSAWGEPLDSDPLEIDYGYREERHDPAIGKIYLRARYLAPSTGRFLSTDPFEGVPERPISRHRYLYANNNPIRFVDPSGRISTLAEVIVGLSVAALAQQAVAVAVDLTSKLNRVQWNGTLTTFAITADILKLITKAKIKPNLTFGFVGYRASSSCQGTRVKNAAWLMVGGGYGVGSPVGAGQGAGFEMSSPGFFGPDPIALVGFSWFAGYTLGIGPFGLPEIPGFRCDRTSSSRPPPGVQASRSAKARASTQRSMLQRHTSLASRSRSTSDARRPARGSDPSLVASAIGARILIHSPDELETVSSSPVRPLTDSTASASEIECHEHREPA